VLRLISRFLPGPNPQRAALTHPEIQRARTFLQSGEPSEAAQICSRLLVADPENAEAHNVLGGTALQQGRNELAIDHFSRAVQIDSKQPSFHQGIGIAYCNLQRLPEAVRCFQLALALDQKNPAAHNNLGNCHKLAGNLADAKRCYRKAISVSSKFIPAYINLADVLGKQNKHKAAVKMYRKALRIAPDTPENKANLVLLHHRLGLALRQLDKTDEAIASYKDAIATKPEFAMAHNSLGGALLARNELDAAMACFRTALELEPSHSRVHSNILFTMNYLPGSTQEQIYEESLLFDSQHARGLLQGRKPFSRSRDKKKILRIGYLSPDFREHSVAHFTRKLLGEHNREATVVHCYADVETPDDLTGQFQAQADHWLSIADMGDADIAEHIRQDRIDILVDLAGHTSNNRLLVFARKPAPIQVTWLGYPNTTGMRAMDYRLTDAVADPPGDADRLHTEKLVRLDHGFLCYQTDESIPAVAPPPCLQQGHVTFGSFNTIKKVTPDVVRIWSRILQSVPGARLVMKSNALEDESTRTNMLRAFAEHKITEDRLDLINAVPRRRDHMELYSRVDIGLDPFPYNGTTTTFEALWMGVPVICLRGDRHAGRVGESIMSHLGLPELVADSEDQYVDLAKRFADDTQRLVTLRNTMRSQMRDSELMNVPLFTETLEKAYRQMWITWCNK
jgi:predicted O-linked N-acetylglucosamine transferase (SPINDLY family)